MTSAKNIVRTNVARLLGERALTSRQLARLAGLSERTVGVFLDGTSMNVRSETLNKMAGALGVTAGDLLREADGSADASRPQDDLTTLLAELIREMKTLVAQNAQLIRLLAERK